MLSRIADSLFWLSRYMERVEGMLRLARTHYMYSLDTNQTNSSWKPILQIYTDLPDDKMAILENDNYAVLNYLLVGINNENSTKNIIQRARENARGIQDHITREVWEEVNAIYHTINRPFVGLKLASLEALEIIDLFIKHSMIYAGVADVTMQRGPGWDIMKLGKFVERGIETLVLTDKQFELFDYEDTKERDIIHWRFLLFSLAGYEAYLKTYRNNKHYQQVLQQVLFNPDFPHSVLYCLNQIDRSLTKVVGDNSHTEITDLRRIFGRMHSKVRFIDPHSLKETDLRTFFAELKQEFQQFNAKLQSIFFSY
ncbi:alpha-E domain-containing protein [Olivibacter ginsenosidimutans]|uniref:Alpha-E domain-containing protein n=1 Tax=Olivibacter ginsenosidimutans TaxID=1176537 RepID=A0ABP9ADA3_9SPHI